jgi:hypothetical protein
MKLSALLPCALLAALVAPSASAEATNQQAPVTPVALNASVIGNFVQWTYVKGNIKVPANTASGALAGMTCNDIIVSATSQATNPAPSGGIFTTPKWTHVAHASGTISSGSCAYSITVPPNQAFGVTVGGAANASNVHCYLLGLGTSPAQAGWFKVPLGGTQEQNFALTSAQCENMPG